MTNDTTPTQGAELVRAMSIASEAQRFEGDHSYIGRGYYMHDLAWALRILAAELRSPGPQAASQGVEAAAWQTAQPAATGEPPIKCLESWHQGFLASSRAQVEIDAERQKPLDDPHLQELFGDCIEGALAFGYQGSNEPPEGHWLWRFWNIGRAEAAAPPAPALASGAEPGADK
jgi:hypothetical protein